MEAALVCSVLAVGVLAAGCNDPNKARLAMLENQNAQLASEQGQLMSDLQRARDAAAQARREAEMFRAQRAATPEPPAEWKGVSGGAMTSIPGSLLFDSGKATLIAGAREKLDKIADTILSEFANKDVYVFGHTDAQPIQHSKWRDNRHLSSERALVVVDYLQTRGISPERCIAAAAGQFRPAVEGVNARQNRRVEIYAVSGLTMDRP
jgi:chemotaxis protein MotB